MNIADIIIIGIFSFLFIWAFVAWIADKKDQKEFKENIKVGTKLRLIYYKFEDGSVDATFNAEVISIETPNKVVIKYSDGSTEHNYITGFVSLYSKGWRIEK